MMFCKKKKNEYKNVFTETKRFYIATWILFYCCSKLKKKEENHTTDLGKMVTIYWQITYLK